MPTVVTAKQRARIIAVDVSQRRVDARLRDGGVVQVAMWEVPTNFRWPQVDEVWIIFRQNNFWVLGSRVQHEEEVYPIEQLQGDTTRIDSVEIKTNQGKDVVTTHNELAVEGDTILWSGTEWLPGPIDTGPPPTPTVVGGAILCGRVSFMCTDAVNSAGIWVPTVNGGMVKNGTAPTSAVVTWDRYALQGATKWQITWAQDPYGNPISGTQEFGVYGRSNVLPTLSVSNTQKHVVLSSVGEQDATTTWQPSTISPMYTNYLLFCPGVKVDAGLAAGTFWQIDIALWALHESVEIT